ncbi:uncharacterized protein LOC134244148 [Saccostrea cucullata]|uniref:uncharacterized protein LOC134244148 n=1 Tax=Saccostrea cuccullata TaxID=36930 RepID=UPI002ED3995F
MSLYTMDTLEFRDQCRVRQCFQCQDDTEFYCNTCKHELCLKCKEKHFIDLYTIYHDVVIYREKFDHITKQETCDRHPDMLYEKYCHSCKLPICFQCTEHRHHQILDLGTAYKTNRQEHRNTLHNIRSETFYNSCCLLVGIRSDIKNFHGEISNNQSNMIKKAQKLRNLIDVVMYDVKIGHKRFIQSLQQQKRKIAIHLASIENFELRSEQLANRPLKFLMFLKRTCIQKLKDTLNLTHYALVCLNEDINIEDVTDFLGEIQITETGKRQVRNESVLKLMSKPVLHRTVNVPGEVYNIAYNITHISFVTPNQAWINDSKDLILINLEGDILRQLRDVYSMYGQHTVNLTGDLIYIDSDGNIIKLSKDNRTKNTLIKKTKPWVPQCIYSSHLNGDLLVGMQSNRTVTIASYNDKGQHKQSIQHHKPDQKLYSHPIYITEKNNGDVIVSDIGGYHSAVVVTDSTGRHRFSYRGHPSGSRLSPCGICTDALSHILVCDFITSTIHMLDKDGHFLSLIQTQRKNRQVMNGPMGLGYDDKTHLLWVGLSYGIKKVRVYRYIERQDYLQYIKNQSKLDI